MAVYPEFTDTLSFAQLKKGQIPFYILHQSLKNFGPLHHHDFAEFSFIYAGSGTETINGRTFPLVPGTIRFLLPHQIHSMNINENDPLQLYCCMFDFSVLFESPLDFELCKLLLRVGDRLPQFNVLDRQRMSEMQQLCARMLEEYTDVKAGKNSALRNKLIDALLLYVRSFSNIPLSELALHSDEPNRKDWEIIRYLNNHFIHSVTLKGLSERFGVSVASISLIFKKHLGRGFLEHLHTLRIRRASGLLLTTDMNIIDVSEVAGFESFRTFSRLFKEMMNMTPSEFRSSFKNMDDSQSIH